MSRRHHVSIVGSLLLLMTTVLIWLTVSPAGPSHADAPPVDYACRGCHRTSEQRLEFPNGESLPLQVPVETLDASPHSVTGEISIPCTDCHQDQDRYQYPHPPITASSPRAYKIQVAARCEDCHQPHHPYHDDSARLENDYPTCAGCHGSHHMDEIENILDSMPDNCLACHNEPRDWAVELVRPSPGLGEPAAGYVGSNRCGLCHDDLYLSWRETLHAVTIQDPTIWATAITGDFDQRDVDLTFDETDVAYTIGRRWMQRYLTPGDDGMLYVLPAEWHFETEEWDAYHPDTWQEETWQENCSYCHVTGLDTESWGFVEFGIGCESCHGPGADHVADPEAVKPFAEVDEQVCGACHSRGESPQGHPFPTNYKPGDTLTDHFTFNTSPEVRWPNGSARIHNQQYTDWQLGSTMYLAPNVTCVTCHAVHGGGVAQGQLTAPTNELCLACHNDKRALAEHTPFHYDALQRRDFLCSDCHMPKMATSAVPYDIRNHSFLQPDPQASIGHGGVDRMPNACNLCHTGLAETPAWAVETISYARAVGTPAPAAFFGPGPTPTSPPPPTPLPSVGQQPDVESVQVETGRWIRYTVIGLFWAFVVFVLYLIYQAIRSRGAKNA